MMETGMLQVEERTNVTKGENKRLRRRGYVPGNVYGKGLETTPVAVKRDELRRALNQHGRNAVLEIDQTNGEKFTVMVKEIQYTPIISEFMHVDFQEVSFLKEIKTEVPVKIIGREIIEAKRLLLMWQTDIINVKGLPQDIPDSIEVDVSNLKAADVITVKDLKIGDGLTIETEIDQVVLSINEGKVHEIVEPNE